MTIIHRKTKRKSKTYIVKNKRDSTDKDKDKDKDEVKGLGNAIEDTGENLGKVLADKGYTV